ncbi:polysaccharide pyruvyl transferase family protein [Salinisphaera sp. T31B1]|uniref:polysaccharide pyruvyl transferase family protein n=1 Tax=Salinisphaera sp. T31B1 TaxID=727963 RepID=UPI00333F0DC5
MIGRRHVDLVRQREYCTSAGPRLKSRLSALLHVIPRDKPVVYFDYPVHGNVGDLLIHLATDRFFHEHGYHVARTFSWRPRGRHARRVPSDATLVFHGGGNLGDLYPGHERLRQAMLERYPDHKAVIMPQSIHYSTPDARDRSLAAYARYRDLTICARDDVSRDLLASYSDIGHLMIPDMTHQLEDALPAVVDRTRRSDALFFLRTDKERDEQRSARFPEMGAEDQSWDWERLLTARDATWIQRHNTLHKYLYLANLDRVAYETWSGYRARILRRALALFQGANHVYTDRLHGGLFALLTGAPVTLADNNNGKIGHYHRTWLSGHPDVTIRD